jgi:hypothetical protein
VLAALLLSACGGRTPPPVARTDDAYAREMRLGLLALEAQRFEDAARRYQLALDRARERDDAPAIAEAAAGRAAALLEREEPEAARRTTSEALADLARRRAIPPVKLLLADAAARLGNGDLARAETAAHGVAQRSGEDPAAARRAAFILGLAAARRRDAARLADIRSVLPAATEPAFRADIAELSAQAALLAGDAATARREAEAAIPLRREAQDLRGITRALLLGAAAARLTGDAAGEADYLFRAAQGAAAREANREARRLLPLAEAAARRAGDAALAQRVRRLLADLPPEER